MALLFSARYEDFERWHQALVAELGDLDFRLWTPDGANIGDPADIEFVLAWGPKKGAFKEFPNLKAIFSLGAGVDHLMVGRDLPEDVPVVRLGERSWPVGPQTRLLQTLAEQVYQ